jgi:hypothetical protein
MRNVLLCAALAALSTPAAAGPIQRACLHSDRNGASPQVCACIQSMADRWLSGADQRLAARFFRDPDKAQAIRISDTPEHDAFWDRYTAFGTSAAAECQR